MPAVERLAVNAEPWSGNSIDMASLLLSAYELGDSINQSAEVAEYLYWKEIVEKDEHVRAVQRRFFKAKELFEECQRFGRYHPDFHSARKEAKKIEQELAEIECVSKFKAAELAVDTLLHDVAAMLAEAVSDTIKVPSNQEKPSGCGNGGSCSCGSGGCG
ncbi:YlbF family regulator [Paenibacillus protaetiae]|uniref:YlbF family regulator n=1 Tax=Paenibacillus protaetiae TaxID=2509456 RepID=A0A4P6ERH6_9BACL|nr:YlbF family regulator [Paenibacillus protaetiae]QAY65502.1 YlbF family regulator [Paenibacillus protaetiae]